MLTKKHFTILTVFVFHIFGCGGGGGSDSPPPSPTPSPTPIPTPQPTSDAEVIKTALGRTAEELVTAAKNLVDDNYNGVRQANNLDLTASAFAINTLVEHKEVTAIESAIKYSINQELSSSESQVINCFSSGSVEVKQSSSASNPRNMVFEYSECHVSDDFAINGTLSLRIIEQQNAFVNLSAYFTSLTITQNTIEIMANGYLDLELPIETFDIIKRQDVYVLIEDQLSTRSFVLDSDVKVIYEDFNPGVYQTKGSMLVDDFGIINFDLNNFYYEFPAGSDEFPTAPLGLATLASDNRAMFDFEVSEQILSLVLYQQDSNNDGRYDKGAYYRDQNELFTDGIIKELFPLDVLSIPPFSPEPLIIDKLEIFTDSVIRISTDPSLFDDPDTPLQELEVRYQWYLNDVLLPEYTSDFLPAGIAVFGDIVSTLRIVSDETNTVVSAIAAVAITDSVPVLILENAPESASPGDAITFVATLFDPDIAGSSFIPEFFDGPEGASIENGMISWTVPESQLFPLQYYNFSFYLDETETNNIKLTHTVKVQNEDDKVQTFTTFEYEIDQRHVTAGDFNGDGIDQLVFSDRENHIFVFTKEVDRFTLDWTNVFDLQISDQIQQVVSADIDKDAIDEILIATREGIFVMSPYQEGTRPLYLFAETDVTSSEILLIDSVPYFFTVFSPPDSSNIDLYMVNLIDSTERILLSGIEQIPTDYAVGNIDLDTNAELVLDTGLGIDFTTGSIDWDTTISPQIRELRVIDINEDGVDEIVGVTKENQLAVLNALDGSQEIADIDYDVCNTFIADVVNDLKDELLIQPCLGSFFAALELKSGNLENVWSYSFDDKLTFGSTLLEVASIDTPLENSLIFFDGEFQDDKYTFAALELKSDSNAVLSDDFLTFRNILPLGWHTESGVVDSAAFAIKSVEQNAPWQFLSVSNNADPLLSNAFTLDSLVSPQAQIFDIGNDGLYEVPVSAFSTPTSISLLSVFDGTEVASFNEPDKFSNSSFMSASDLDKDGVLDLLAIYDEGFIAFDFETNTTIAEKDFSQSLGDVLPDDSGETSVVYSIDAQGINVSRLQNGQFVDFDFIFQDCYSIFLINDDLDQQKELGCFERLNNESAIIHIFDITDEGVTPVRKIDTNLLILDIVADPSQDVQQGFFVRLRSQLDKNNMDSFYPVLGRLSRDGVLMYRSPALFKEASEANLKVRKRNDKAELLFGTRKVGYWFRE